MTQIDYKFNESKYFDEARKWVDDTYDGYHYSQNKIQSTEVIVDAGHGEGFCIGNILKYAKRYGKKEGYNKKDILKLIHYAIIMLHVHDKEHKLESPGVSVTGVD